MAVGAHPGYPDRVHFGRRPLAEQAGRLGLRLAHVKPHGALYNAAARDAGVARAIAQAVAEFDPALVLVGLSGSQLIAAGVVAGLAVLDEAFADRRYQADGPLVSRETSGALVTDPEKAAHQALALAQGLPIATLNSGPRRIAAGTICLHGDTPNALNIGRAVHAALNRG